MFRAKVAASLFLVFVAAAIVMQINVSESVEAETRSMVEQRLQVAKRAVEQSRRLNAFAIVAKAEEVASWTRMAEVLTKPIENFADEEGTLPSADDYAYELHRLMNVEVDVWKLKFEALAAGKGRRPGLMDLRSETPDWFLVVNSDGIGVANSRDPAWFGPVEANLGKQYPAVMRAMRGAAKSKGSAATRPGPLHDIWAVKDAPMMVAVAPIRAGNRVVGAVVLGYRLTDGEAKSYRELVGTEVAFHLNGKVTRSSSLSPSVERQLQKLLEAKTVGGVGREPYAFQLNNSEHLALGGMFEDNATGKNAGFIVLADLEGAQKKAAAALVIIPLGAGLGFVLCLGLVLILFQRFMAPFEEIDRGVMELINGNLDYWFEAGGKELPSTMSQNLNIMVCSLSGRPLPDEEEGLNGPQWQESGMRASNASAPVEVVDSARVARGDTAGISAEIVTIVVADRESYERAAFRDYTEGLRRTGEPLQGITFEKFVEQLSKSAADLQQRHACREVRFHVRVDNNRVALQPIPIS